MKQEKETMPHPTKFTPHYNPSDRNHMRQFLQKASTLINLIAANQVAWGSQESADLADELADEMGYEREKQMDEDALKELREDRQVLVNLYGAAKRRLNLPELYAQLGSLLRKYGLFDEEVVLLENAVADGSISDEKLTIVKDRLRNALKLREADDACLSDSERIAETLRRALREKPLDKEKIMKALEQCSDDTVLYDIACNTDKDPAMILIREKAARRMHSRDFKYALSSHLQHHARTAMILDLYDPLEGDDLFIARTILTDPRDENKTHMLLFCRDEALLKLGWRYVYGARRTCRDHLHDMGSRFPEAYIEMDPQGKARCEQEWLAHAAEVALNILPEDEAVRGRISGTADVDSEPLHFFLSFHHPRLAIRWWHARKLKNPARIAYVGSWTSDDQIKEALSVKIFSTRIIKEMIYGNLSAVDLVLGFRKPQDMTLQDRFLAAIAKNNPDPAIREYARRASRRIDTGNTTGQQMCEYPLYHKLNDNQYLKCYTRRSK